LSTSPENKKRRIQKPRNRQSLSGQENQRLGDAAMEATDLQDSAQLVESEAGSEAQEVMPESKPRSLSSSSTKGRISKTKPALEEGPTEELVSKKNIEDQQIGETAKQSQVTPKKESNDLQNSKVNENGGPINAEINALRINEPAGQNNLEDLANVQDSNDNFSKKKARNRLPTLLSAFRKWLVSLFAKRIDATPSQDSLEKSQEEELEEHSTKEIRNRIRQLRTEIKASQAASSSAELEVAFLEKKILSNDKNARTALEWMSSVDGSYQWKVQEKMDAELKKAKDDMAHFTEAAKGVKDFATGRLIELRKKFHKSISGPVLFLTPVVLLVFLIPLLFTLSRIGWLDALYNPELLAPVASAVTGVVIGAVVVARRALGKEKLPNRRIIKWAIIAVLVGFFVSSLPFIEEVFRRFVLPFLERYTPEILWSAASIIIFWTLIALIFYHVEWSKYKKQVEDQVRELRGVVAGYKHSTQEVHRLTSLHEQTSSWLEILAHALYRPWRVNPDWEKSGELGARVESFPFALRIAEVRDEAGPESAELERLISAKLMVQGWRAEAFADLVDQVRADLGLPEDKFSVDVLDKDLPHQTNNTRTLLRKYLEKSGEVSSSDSETVPIHDKYLVEVARKRLIDLVNETQSVALSTARPRVSQVLIDPLAEIDLDSESLGDLEDSVSWDDFLKESLGTDEILQPPISILNFSDKGRLSRGAESPETFIITPKRLVGALPPSRSDSITIIPVGDSKARSVELIARLDIAGPLESEMLQVLSGGDNQASARNLNLCKQCSDPLCDSSMDPSKACSSDGL